MKCINTLSVLTVLLVLSANVSWCYNILVIFGYPGRSHFEVFAQLFRELARRGHNITIVSHFPIEDIKHENIRNVSLGEGLPMTHVVNIQDFKESFSTPFLDPKMIMDFALEFCPKDLMNKNLQEFLKKDTQYDVVLAELFNTNCYFGAISKFKAPFIGLSSCVIFPWQSPWFGTPENPSYTQNIFAGYPRPMSFFDRVENTLVLLITRIWYQLMENSGSAMSLKYTGYEVPDPHKASLFLVNTHHSLHGARPLSPSVIEVGGIHVTNRPPKKLPQALEDWINNAAAGVIYFSLGSMIKGHTFPEKQRLTFLGAFSQLHQRVLWKWENDSMPDKPDNVMTKKWMPQYDILCHPNVKVFISHGGLLGMTEAVHCGVPVIVMPQFGDQRHNAHVIQYRGMGVILQSSDVTEEALLRALKKVMDPQFVNNAKEVSRRFKDRPLNPLDSAVYWVEHVARHKGADHMRPPSVGMPFYQYFLMDVIAFLALVTFVLLYVGYRMFRSVLGLFVKREKATKQKKS